MGSCLSSSNQLDATQDLVLSGSLFPENNPRSFNVTRAVKLLLYGPGECGKTTILRRMMLINNQRQQIAEELRRFRGSICFNVIEGCSVVLNAMKTIYDDELEPEFQSEAKIVDYAEQYFVRELRKPSEAHLEIEGLVQAIRTLYLKSKMFRKTLRKRAEYSLFNNWKYFVKKLQNYPAWGGPRWIPSENDLLHSRIRTTGVNEVRFKSENLEYCLVDVGGQRAERRKFVSLFANIDCLLFVGCMSDYDEKLYEDSTVNRLTEIFQVYEKTIKLKEFQDSWVILFVNKRDLFEKKYRQYQIPIGNVEKAPFPPPRVEDEEEGSITLAERWFRDCFIELTPKERRERVKIYFTSALDATNNIEQVMRYCVTLIQNQVTTL